MKRFWPLLLPVLLLFGACSEPEPENVEVTETKEDSVMRVVEQDQKAEEEFKELSKTDSSYTFSRARFLDIEEGDRLNLLVKDDSGNMRRFFIDPTMPMQEWQSIQHPSNRGHWLQLLWHRRMLPASNDSTPGFWVNEVVGIRKERRL